jgi:hypothetical protein
MPKIPDDRIAEFDRHENTKYTIALARTLGVSDELYLKAHQANEATLACVDRLKLHSPGAALRAIVTTMGYRAYGGGDFWEALLKAGRRQVRAEGFSSINLPDLIGNVANKLLIQEFVDVDATYERIAEQADFSNFHMHSIYRLEHTGEFALVSKDGELKHGQLVQSGFTNKLETSGQILVLTRQDLLNDDLGAFRSLTVQLARKARVAVERSLYLVVCESTDSFYTTAGGNRLVTTPLDITGMAAAEAALLMMTDQGGEPIYAQPRYVLVPPQLRYLADSIFVSEKVMQLTSGVSVPTDNVFRGKYEPLSSPMLASPAIPGSSTSGWYMLADPSVLPAFQVVYLGGVRTPTIETSETVFNVLGMAMRCFFDWGVARIDPKGAVKATP